MSTTEETQLQELSEVDSLKNYIRGLTEGLTAVQWTIGTQGDANSSTDAKTCGNINTVEEGMLTTVGTHSRKNYCTSTEGLTSVQGTTGTSEDANSRDVG
jgi:hypothetical protein